MLIAIILWSSLAPSIEVEVVFFWQDKIFHFLAYFGLTLWFLQLAHKKSQMLLVALGAISLGILVEYLQGLTGYRLREGWDVVANTSGVLIASLLKPTLLGNILSSLETRLLRQC